MGLKAALSTIVLAGALVIGTGAGWSLDKVRYGVPENGRILYGKLKCVYCHKINGEGGTAGPELTHIGSAGKDINWHIRNLTDPKSTHPKHPDPYMPKFDKLTDKMLLDLASYLESLK